MYLGNALLEGFSSLTAQRMCGGIAMPAGQKNARNRIRIIFWQLLSLHQWAKVSSVTALLLCPAKTFSGTIKGVREGKKQ